MKRQEVSGGRVLAEWRTRVVTDGGASPWLVYITQRRLRGMHAWLKSSLQLLHLYA